MSSNLTHSPRARLGDVAQLAGVSKSIASKVINNSPELSVRPETRERVLSAAASLRYRPHAGARALTGARTHAVALLVPALTNPVYVNIVRGAYSRARVHGYILLLAEDFDEQAADETFSDLVEGGRVDGLLIASARPSHPLIDSFTRHSVPHVFVNRQVRGQLGNITMDDAMPSRIAIEHLVELGHLAIGHVAGPDSNEPGRRREIAFRKAARTSQLLRAPVRRADYTEEAGAHALTVLLRRNPDLTAVYASSLSQSIGVMHAARGLGLRIPDDLSVIGCDDAPLAAFLAPPLTTIAMPLASLGGSAVDELIAQLAGAPVRDLVIDTEPKLVIRGSTAPPIDSMN